MKSVSKKVSGTLSALLFVSFGLISVNVHAQEQQTSAESGLSPKFGIKGGLNLTNLYVDNANDEHLKAGFNAGVYAKLPLTKGFSIQPELLYTVKGAKETYGDNFVSNFVQGGSGEYQFNLGYIELPVLAVINVAKNLNIHVGPYVSYLTNANVKKVNDNGNIEDAENLKVDNFKRFDYGLVGGLGLDIQNFTIGARYNYGLNEIGKNDNLSGDLTKNSKNAGISVYVGFAF